MPVHRNWLLAAIPFEPMHVTGRDWRPLPQVTEHAPQFPDVYWYATQGCWLQLVCVEAQPPWHWDGSTGAPLEAMHTRWVVCTPWPHVTEHEVPALTQPYVKTGAT